MVLPEYGTGTHPCRVHCLARSNIAGYDWHMEFEWDPEKAARNLAKHGVTFHEAATVLGDAFAGTY